MWLCERVAVLCYPYVACLVILFTPVTSWTCHGSTFCVIKDFRNFPLYFYDCMSLLLPHDYFARLPYILLCNLISILNTCKQALSRCACLTGFERNCLTSFGAREQVWLLATLFACRSVVLP